jgi:hypothetical protein
MAQLQLFSPGANLVARGNILLAVLGLAGVCALVYAGTRSAYHTGAKLAVEQPVPFSHAHHVGGLGIDCRYCHTSVEVSWFAGIPPTETCMNCHWQLWTRAEMLEPVRESWWTDRPLRWNRVYNLPGFVYFDHSIHIAKGIGCVSCHGRVDRMPLMEKAEPVFMKFCLDCHRHPEGSVRPRDAVFSMEWQPAENQEELGRRLVAEYRIEKDGLTNCSICHR